MVKVIRDKWRGMSVNRPARKICGLSQFRIWELFSFGVIHWVIHKISSGFFFCFASLHKEKKPEFMFWCSLSVAPKHKILNFGFQVVRVLSLFRFASQRKNPEKFFLLVESVPFFEKCSHLRLFNSYSYHRIICSGLPGFPSCFFVPLRFTKKQEGKNFFC